MKVFTTPNSKNIISTLRITTIEESEFTFLLILYFHEQTNNKNSIFMEHLRWLLSTVIPPILNYRSPEDVRKEREGFFVPGRY